MGFTERASAPSQASSAAPGAPPRYAYAAECLDKLAGRLGVDLSPAGGRRIKSLVETTSESEPAHSEAAESLSLDSGAIAAIVDAGDSVV